MRPLLTILSRTHEYDDRLTRELQVWKETEEEMSSKWTFAASTLYALTVITSTGQSILFYYFFKFFKRITFFKVMIMLLLLQIQAEYLLYFMVY